MRDVSPITAKAALPTWIRKIFLAAAVVAISTMTASANPERWKAEGWSKTDFTKSAIPFGEILSGGPPKDGIPAIDKPVFETLAKLTAKQTPKTTAPVISLEINGDARAYPLRVLTWHEIANDTVGGIPVTVTYCPLCNAAIVFDRRLNGRVLDFGTSGKLRHSDLVMYDRQTESWWQQFSGEAIIGTLTGKSLKIIPSRLESFGEFAARFPNGRLLVPTDTAQRPYGTNPYVGYDTAKAPFLYRGAMPKGISPMARVIVFSKSATPTAVALQFLREKRELTVGPVRLTWRAGQTSALDTSDIDKGRDIGTVTAQKLDALGTWTDIAYDVTFAFVFHAFHPDQPIRAR